MRLIDGQAAIDAIQKRRLEAWDEYKDDQEYRFGYDDSAADTMKILAELPSAQPELNTQLYTDGFNDGYAQCKKDKTQWVPKKGKWVDNSPVTCKCDQCGYVIRDWFVNQFGFCPNCGADMRGEQNGNKP